MSNAYFFMIKRYSLIVGLCFMANFVRCMIIIMPQYAFMVSKFGANVTPKYMLFQGIIKK